MCSETRVVLSTPVLANADIVESLTYAFETSHGFPRDGTIMGRATGTHAIPRYLVRCRV